MREELGQDTNMHKHSLKLKRPQAARKFRAEIDRMYEEINAAAQTKARL